MGVRIILRAIPPAGLALALALAAPTPHATAAPLAVDPALTVHSVTLSRSSVAVSGLNVVPVEVRVSASYDPAVPDVPLSVLLDRTAAGGSLPRMAASNLPRVSGTAASGVWGGTLFVPSTAGGSFKVTAVSAGFDSPVNPIMTEPTPFDGPTLSVTGVHQPRITVTTYPNPVPQGSSYALGGTVIDSATGLPYATTIPVEIGVDNTCVEYTRPVVRTTTAGKFAYRLPAAAAEGGNCAILANAGTFIAGITVTPVRVGWIGAAPSATRGTVGAPVGVHGKTNGTFCPVQLQRLRGDTQWRTVAVARVRQSGRFTLLAPLPVAGTLIFRAYLPGCTSVSAAAGRPFLIRAS